MSQEIFEQLYREGKTLWSVSEPPAELKTLVENGTLKPGRVLDIGCGEGHIARYLSEKGFDVTGVDFAPTAIERAKAQAVAHNLEIKFFTADATDLALPKETFDAVIEWGVFHTIMPPDRRRYLAQVALCLKPGAFYLSASFSWYDNALGGSSLKYRLAPDSKLRLYYSSHAELKKLFSEFFAIQESKIIGIPSASGYHSTGNYFLLRKR